MVTSSWPCFAIVYKTCPPRMVDMPRGGWHGHVLVAMFRHRLQDMPTEDGGHATRSTATWSVAATLGRRHGAVQE